MGKTWKELIKQFDDDDTRSKPDEDLIKKKVQEPKNRGVLREIKRRRLERNEDY